MRIHGFGTGSVEERDRSKAEPNAQVPAADAGDREAVVVSSGTQMLSAAVTRGSAARSERVATVRSQVQSGTYHIDRDKLANRIADDELERAGSR
jgi:flagellar biosynthesis anti-sigma factor FlgM